MPILIFRNGKVSGKKGYGQTYDGEKDMGDLSNWHVLTSDANDILDGTYNLLSERSTTLYHTYPPVRSAINKQTNFGIGPGLVFRSQPDFKTLGISKESAVDWGKDFQKIVHYYSRRFNFYEKQSVLFRTAMYAGDSLLFFLREDNGLLSDLIEASGDQIDSGWNQGKYTLGIKHDEWLRREGIKKIDGKEVSFTNSVGDQNIIQFYLKEISRQLRGYPIAYSIINHARNDDTHWDATTHRAVMEAQIMGVFKGSGTDLDQQAKNLARKNRLLKTGDTTGTSAWNRLTNAIKLGAGNIFTFNNQEEMDFTDLKTPSNTFDVYKDWVVRYVAMATDTPPEIIMSLYRSSFSAHKGALNDFIKSYLKKRKTFERTVMDVVIREIAKDAITRKYISAPGFFDGGPFYQDAYLAGMYLGPVPGHINPSVEVKAEIESVNAGFDLRSDMAAKRGHDWDVFFPEWEQEQNDFTSNPQKYADKVAAELAAQDEKDIGGNNA